MARAESPEPRRKRNRALFARLFPDRQIIIRTDIRVRSLTLTGRLQAAVCVIVLLAFGIGTGATVLAAAQRTMVATYAAEHAQALADRDVIQEENGRLATVVRGLEEQVVALRSAQDSMVTLFSHRAAGSVARIEKSLGLTGLNVDDLLSSLRKGAAVDRGPWRSEAVATFAIQSLSQGGPFIAIDPDDRDGLRVGGGFGVLDRHLGRLEDLERLMRSLPLTSPVRDIAISSGFGARRDPFNGHWARHNGLDFTGEHRTPVHATAPGRVTSAGFRGRYGNTVEIEHSYGISTIYGHLSKITVSEGARVARGQQIGLMGSTGRSTGTHLHYEIQVDGETIDPIRFLKAGQHVFKK